MENKQFEESGYRFSFPAVQRAIKADAVNYAGLSFVDFIVETDSMFYFIEVKNPDNPNAPSKNRNEYFDKLQETVFPNAVVKKFSDTLLAQLAMGYSFPKPVQYIFILEFGAFSSYERQILFDKVTHRLPVGLNHRTFTNVALVKNFKLLTIAQFEEQYQDFTVQPL